jgi:UDP-sugar transporter A1/2/3
MMATHMNPPLLPRNKRAIVLGLLFLVSQSTTTLATTEYNPHHQHLYPVQVHPSSDKPFDGPLAPGLQVSGGTKLKRAKNKIKRAARRVRAFQNELRGVQQRQLQLRLQTEPPTETGLSAHVEPHVYYSTQPTETTIQEIKPAFITPLAPPAPVVATQTTEDLPRQAILYMTLLAVQFGVQPILVRQFTPQGICKSSVVLTQELVKGVIAFGAYIGSTRPEVRSREISSLSLRTWLTMAGIPAAIYTVQNLASLLAYQNLEALTFNVLNQTKILSAALCCYLVMGKKQTKKQSFSLVLLLISALVIEDVISIKSILAITGGARAFAMPESMKFDRHFTHGVVPVLFASLLSGLAGALTQKNLQGVTKSQSPTGVQPNPKNPYLFSMELSVASVLVLLTSLLVSADGKQISQNGFFYLWTLETIIPVLTNSFGGILVGLVTKHAGSVRKGFVLIFGILLSGLFQAGSVGVSSAQIIGGILAATSLFLHSSSSHRAVSK